MSSAVAVAGGKQALEAVQHRAVAVAAGHLQEYAIYFSAPVRLSM
jgi:hypothetical protein